MRYLAPLVGLMLLMAACSDLQTIRQEDAIQVGQVIWDADYAAFEQGAGREISGRTIMQGDAYNLQINADLKVYNTGTASLELVGKPLGDYQGRAYGLMCRVTASDNGYLFLVDAQGRGAIANLVGGELTYLLEFSEEVTEQISEVKATCENAVLTLAINGEVVGSIEDNTHPTVNETMLVGALLQETDLDLQSLDSAIEVLDMGNAQQFDKGFYRHVETTIKPTGGSYQIELSCNRAAYIWSQGGNTQQNLVVEAQAVTRSDFADNLYGVMCRVSPTGEGYAFLISSDGFGAIARSDGKSLTFIRDWVQNEAIKPTSTIRGACVDDYFALFVNDVFIGDAQDSAYPSAGQVAMLAGIFVEASDQTGDITALFEDLTISEATLTE